MTSTAPYTPSSTSQKNGLALASLILGIVAITFILNFLLLPSILGLIFGILGLRRAPLRGRRVFALVGIILSGIALLIGLVVGLVGIASATRAASTISDVQSSQAAVEPSTEPSAAEATVAADEPSAEPTEEVTQEPELTTAQENAVESAKSYIDYSGFSKKSLIKQLVFEKYSTKDATFAVEYIKPDFKAEAVESAKSYLSYTSFSRSGLIQQLKFEGFTNKQAAYGASKNGY